jgi:cell division protein FtsW
VLLLVGFGLVMVYSSSSVLSLARHGSSTTFFQNQAAKALLGVMLMAAASRVDYRIWARVSKPLMWVVLALLVFLALPFGTALTPEINGARRWIAFPGLTFQPIELAKLAIIVWMSAILALKAKKLDQGIDQLVPLLLLPLVMAGLVVLQPDFKGAIMIGVLAAVLLFMAGVKWRYLIQAGATGIPLAAVVMVLEPYRMRRLAAFLDPTQDVQGISYQINQSLISLGSGGWFGVGLGSSKQKFAFLPMAHTDFILSIVGEELGIIGTLVVLVAFVYLGALGYRIARRAPDDFGFLLGSGLTTLILFSALVNIGVATAVLPTTGLPLPFVSYGGTALIVHMAAIGILLSISRDGVDPPRAEPAIKRWRWWRRLVPVGRWRA